MPTKSDSSEELQLTKMQGAGNSFLMTDKVMPKNQRIHATQRLCDPHFGIGADGMVFLSFEKKGIFEWDFYNSDGSSAEFCGNAARCAALYIFEKYPEHKKIEIKTLAGKIRCEVKSLSVVEVEMPKVEWLAQQVTIPFWPKPVAWLNTGVPHIIVEVDSDKNLKKYKTEASQIRAFDQLGPSGANVTFLFMHSPKLVSAISFERGVEDFTLACGTGAVAAASFVMARSSTMECLIQMPGGNLEISLKEGKFFMQGEAYKIAEINVPAEALEKEKR